MGDRVSATEFSPEDRLRYRVKVKACLAALRQLLADQRFETERKLIGLELELNIADSAGCPLMVNDDVLKLIESADYQTELGQFNIEVNVAPHKLVGTVFRELEEEVRTSLNYAERRAGEIGAHIVMIGILPTLRNPHVTLENVTNNPRYALLNDQVLAARGEALLLQIDGVEQLTAYADSIAPEAAATSVQLHLQVSPDGFAPLWNAAQAIAGVQLALGANSPFLLGRQLWQETRIVLLEQSIDTRTEEIVSQGVRPRTWFGERWIDAVTDLFDENVRYYPALLPLLVDEEPAAMLARGDVPHLAELRLHNGTIYRWNRPVYDVARGKPHLRVENRVLAAGPTVVDTMANAAFYYGLVRTLSELNEPISGQMSFATAEENFRTAARHGLAAELFWPGLGPVPAAELVLRRLLPLAATGLDRWHVDPADRDRLLGIIEQRCITGRNGATWQVESVRQLEAAGASRDNALAEMTRRYTQHMHTNTPVHTWPLE